MTNLEQIKSLLKSGDAAGAEALCRKALAETPDDAALKMLFGMCRQLQGDEESFRRIHDELAPEMERLESPGGVPSGGANPPGEPSRLGGDASPHQASPTFRETLSLWRKYHKLWLSLIVGALVLGGAAAGVVVFGKQIEQQYRAMTGALYAGPVNVEKEERPSDAGLMYALYAGPEYYEGAE